MLQHKLADSSHDSIHVHTNVPDEAAHSGDLKRKEAAIAVLDRDLDELVKGGERRNNLLVVVTAALFTQCISPLIHSLGRACVPHSGRSNCALFFSLHDPS